MASRAGQVTGGGAHDGVARQQSAARRRRGADVALSAGGVTGGALDAVGCLQGGGQGPSRSHLQGVALARLGGVQAAGEGGGKVRMAAGAAAGVAAAGPARVGDQVRVGLPARGPRRVAPMAVLAGEGAVDGIQGVTCGDPDLLVYRSLRYGAASTLPQACPLGGRRQRVRLQVGQQAGRVAVAIEAGGGGRLQGVGVQVRAEVVARVRADVLREFGQEVERHVGGRVWRGVGRRLRAWVLRSARVGRLAWVSQVAEVRRSAEVCKPVEVRKPVEVGRAAGVRRSVEVRSAAEVGRVAWVAGRRTVPRAGRYQNPCQYPSPRRCHAASPALPGQSYDRSGLNGGFSMIAGRLAQPQREMSVPRSGVARSRGALCCGQFPHTTGAALARSVEFGSLLRTGARRSRTDVRSRLPGGRQLCTGGLAPGSTEEAGMNDCQGVQDSGVPIGSRPVLLRAAADRRWVRRWAVLLGGGTLVSALWALGYLGDLRLGPPSPGSAAGALLAAAATGLLVEGLLALGIGVAGSVAGRGGDLRGWLATYAAARFAPLLAGVIVLPPAGLAVLRWPGEVHWTGWIAAAFVVAVLAWSAVAMVRAARVTWRFGRARALAVVIAGSLALGVLAVTGVPFRAVVDPYEFPTGSMTPSILPGDRAFVNRVEYGFWAPLAKRRMAASLPRRGDLIVFRTPYPEDDPGHEYMKRVVALPGDRIGLLGDRLFLNGTEVPTLVIDDSVYCDDETLSDCRCIRQFETLGDVAFVSQHLSPYQDGPVCTNFRDWPSEDPRRIRPLPQADAAPARSLAGVTAGTTGEGCGEAVEREPAMQDVEVPEGMLFVMGDNRDNSADSRVLGPIALDLVVGRVAWVYWPPWRVGPVP